jgi:hypothetical protein
MLSLSKRRILRPALRFKYSGLHGETWWLRDQSLVVLGESVVDVVRGIISKVAPPDIEMLKSAKRKTIFRVKNPENSQETFVVKVFFLNHFSHRLSYHLYGLDEAANLIQAKGRGINTPETYGYCHVYDSFGLVRASVLILEDLHNLSPVGELMSTMSESECSKIFMNTVPLFVSLYRANCNHIDVNSNAVMVGNNSSDCSLYLLDFQHAKFYDKPSTEVLMFEAGYFARSCRNWVLPETIYQWLDKIFSHIGVNDPVERGKMRERFDYYFESKGVPPGRAMMSRKHRKRIR